MRYVDDDLYFEKLIDSAKASIEMENFEISDKEKEIVYKKIKKEMKNNG